MDMYMYMYYNCWKVGQEKKTFVKWSLIGKVEDVCGKYTVTEILGLALEFKMAAIHVHVLVKRSIVIIFCSKSQSTSEEYFKYKRFWWRWAQFVEENNIKLENSSKYTCISRYVHVIYCILF